MELKEAYSGIESNVWRERVSPIELKSSKRSNNTDHRAQVVLYNLLMSEQYTQHVDGGLLFYFNVGLFHPLYLAKFVSFIITLFSCLIEVGKNLWYSCFMG